MQPQTASEERDSLRATAHRKMRALCGPWIITNLEIPWKVRCVEDRCTAKEVVDWWPAHEVEKRCATLATARVPWWEMRSGIFTTADALVRNIHEPEQVAAIWVSAALNDMGFGYGRSAYPPYGWSRGAVDLGQAAARYEWSPKVEWHHLATQRLPDGPTVEQWVEPKSFEELLDIVALYVTCVLARHRIVKISRPWVEYRMCEGK